MFEVPWFSSHRFCDLLTAKYCTQRITAGSALQTLGTHCHQECRERKADEVHGHTPTPKHRNPRLGCRHGLSPSSPACAGSSNHRAERARAGGCGELDGPACTGERPRSRGCVRCTVPSSAAAACGLRSSRPDPAAPPLRPAAGRSASPLSSRLQSGDPLHPAPTGAQGRGRGQGGPAGAGSSSPAASRRAGWVALRSASGRGRSRRGGRSGDRGRFRSGAGGSTSERGGHQLSPGAQGCGGPGSSSRPPARQLDRAVRGGRKEGRRPPRPVRAARRRRRRAGPHPAPREAAGGWAARAAERATRTEPPSRRAGPAAPVPVPVPPPGSGPAGGEGIPEAAARGPALTSLPIAGHSVPDRGPGSGARSRGEAPRRWRPLRRGGRAGGSRWLGRAPSRARPAAGARGGGRSLLGPGWIPSPTPLGRPAAPGAPAPRRRPRPRPRPARPPPCHSPGAHSPAAPLAPLAPGAAHASRVCVRSHARSDTDPFPPHALPAPLPPHFLEESLPHFARLPRTSHLPFPRAPALRRLCY